MARRFAVCVVGSANLDLVARTSRHPRPGETVLGSGFAEHPGGKGLNQAVAATRSGATTAFVAAMGNDTAGSTLRAVLEREGIDTGGVTTVDEPTGRALIVVDDHGENSIVVVPGANAVLTAPHAPECSVVLVQLEIPLDVVHIALDAGRRSGATTVLNPAPASALSDELLALCDVVVPNEYEVELLGGASALLASGCGAVVVTRGAAGVSIITDEGESSIEPFDVTPVDTTGAGDAFCGALSARLAVGDSLPLAVRWGAAAGALATTRHGAVPAQPHADEIRRLLDG